MGSEGSGIVLLLILLPPYCTYPSCSLFFSSSVGSEDTLIKTEDVLSCSSVAGHEGVCLLLGGQCRQSPVLLACDVHSDSALLRTSTDRLHSFLRLK